MSKKFTGIISFVFVLLLFPLLCMAQITILSPEKPKWGDTLRVTYDPGAEGAAFLPGDEIYAIYVVHTKNGPSQKWKKMEKKGNLFFCKISIEKGLAFLNFYFITMEKWDSKADVSTMIYMEDGTPARGAYNQQMFAPSKEECLEAFQKERELYPDNYSVFRTKWLLLGAFDRENQLSIVKQDMESLKDLSIQESPELLYSLSYGYMLLDDEEAGRKILLKIVEKYPRSFYAGNAIINYDYQVFSKKIKGEGPEEVNKLKLVLLQKSPLSGFARRSIINLIAKKAVSLESVEAVCRPWKKEEPDNPMPYYTLAYAYIKMEKNIRQAPELLEKAINFLLQGKLRFYDDISGFLTQMYLPRCYKMRAEVFSQTENPAKALSNIKTAQALEKEAKSENYEIEAAIWEKLGLFKKAETALLEAHRLGSEKAKEIFKKIYQKRYGSIEDFDDFYLSAMKKHSSTSGKEKETAPDFEVKTLEGETISLSDLKGKVVVLNFWFIGCAPCRVEMPGLNKLTEEYKEKDVVFIAFALDKADPLKDFLKKKSFKYQIVPEAGKIAGLYGAKVFPTHILINKKGQIEYFLTGGSDTRHEQLRPLINNLLR
jgi:peroxiredoxin